jgi:RNA polymerase sigma-70 factor (ECF subfamily)
MQPVATPHRAAELAARTSFGRLVSYLAWQWRDIAAAEDALGDALLKALEVWPVAGVPDHPDAWLLAVARRQMLQVARHDRVRRNPAVMAVLEADENPATLPAIPDARLKLLFVCAHPAIDEKVRIPLMLQTVLGLQVAEIAPALLVAPSALAQRLVRAKQKIRDTGLRFEEPEERELPARLQQVLECIYGAFGLGIDAVDGAEARITDLSEEAVYLCQIVCNLLPQAAEARGLLALMTFCRARQPAQTDAAGNFVPLALQEVTRWDRAAIVRADQWLWQAAQQKQPGPFQLEAAVQSAHCHRLFTGVTPWQAIVTLYRQINMHFPTQGSLVAGAVAMGEAGNIPAGLEQLGAMDRTRVQSFQPWWVARAHLLALQGAAVHALADVAYRTAIGLTSQQKIRNHLERLRCDLSGAR